MGRARGTAGGRAALGRARCSPLGVLLFSGSLYLLVWTGVTTWGAVTPFGGLAFLAGWIALASTRLPRGPRRGLTGVAADCDAERPAHDRFAARERDAAVGGLGLDAAAAAIEPGLEAAPRALDFLDLQAVHAQAAVGGAAEQHGLGVAGQAHRDAAVGGLDADVAR